MRCVWCLLLCVVQVCSIATFAASLGIESVLELGVETEAGKVYQLESSTDLQTWVPREAWFIGDGNRFVSRVGAVDGAEMFRLTDNSWVNLDQEVESLRSTANVPGLALGIIKEGKLYGIGVAGTRKFGVDAPITLDDKWHQGSITKSMTATLAGLLVEDGIISWDTTIGEVFPERVATMASGWSDITLRQLLAHSAGVPGDLSLDGIWMRLWNFGGTPLEGRHLLLDELLDENLVFTPGTSYEYSNAGYAIAGAMMETLVGKPWEALITERLFEPLGMSSAGFGAPATPRHLDQPLGHAGDRTNPVIYDGGVNSDNPPAIAPGATVHCSLIDLMRYVTLHLRGARGEPALLLTAPTFNALHTDAFGFGYAMGWGVANRTWAGGDALTHTGSNTQWFTNIWIAPEVNWAVVVCMNFGGTDAFTLSDTVVGHAISTYGP